MFFGYIAAMKRPHGVIISRTGHTWPLCDEARYISQRGFNLRWTGDLAERCHTTLPVKWVLLFVRLIAAPCGGHPDQYGQASLKAFSPLLGSNVSEKRIDRGRVNLSGEDGLLPIHTC